MGSKAVWSLMGYISLAGIFLVACGVPKEQYSTAVAERDALRTTATSTSGDVDKLQGSLTDVQAALEKTKGDLTTAQATLAKSQQDLGQTQGDLSTTQKDLSAARAQATDLSDQLSIVRKNNESLTADNSALSARIKTPTYLTYQDPTGAFSIDYPMAWVKQAGAQPGIFINYSSPDSTANIIALSESISQTLTSQTYFNALSPQLTATGATLLSASQVTVAGLNGVQAAYANKSGVQQVFVIAVRDQSAYVVVFTTVNIKAFDWGLTFSEVLKSVRITAPTAPPSATATAQPVQPTSTAVASTATPGG